MDLCTIYAELQVFEYVVAAWILLARTDRDIESTKWKKTWDLHSPTGKKQADKTTQLLAQATIHKKIKSKEERCL